MTTDVSPVINQMLRNYCKKHITPGEKQQVNLGAFLTSQANNTQAASKIFTAEKVESFGLCIDDSEGPEEVWYIYPTSKKPVEPDRFYTYMIQYLPESQLGYYLCDGITLWDFTNLRTSLQRFFLCFIFGWWLIILTILYKKNNLNFLYIYRSIKDIMM